MLIQNPGQRVGGIREKSPDSAREITVKSVKIPAESARPNSPKLSRGKSSDNPSYLVRFLSLSYTFSSLQNPYRNQ